MNIISGDDGATTCKNLVNFFPASPEMTELICVPIYLYRAKIDLHTLTCRAAIENADGRTVY